MSEVEWKTVEGYSRYKVSTDGRVFDTETEREMPQTWNGNFLCTNLYDDSGKKVLCKVHRLVAIVFVENPENAYNVIHKDEDRSNNTVGNLLWKAKKVKLKKDPKFLVYKDKSYTYQEFADLCKISLKRFRIRLNEGWSLRECFVNHKDFTGEGFQTDTHWFPSKAQQMKYDIEVRKAERESKRQAAILRKEQRKNRKVVGVGIRDVEIGSDNPFYRRWLGMLSRCYNEKSLIRGPSYEDKYVCDDWLLLSNFKAWMEKQDWEGLQLDKDILVRGNKVYSPETCVFIPGYVNSSVCLSDRSRGDFPVGVVYHKKDNIYFSKVKSFGEVRSLGYYKTPEAAHMAWQKAKIEELENIINKYSKENCFRTDVADALMSRVWQTRLDIYNGVETTNL